MWKGAYKWGAHCYSGIGISCREPLSPASTSGLLYKPYLYEFFAGGFPLWWSWFGLPSLEFERAPTSATITASAWVRDDPSNLPMVCSPSSCSFLHCISPSKGRVLPEGAPSRRPFFFPALGVSLYLQSKIEQWPIRGHGRLFGGAHSLSF